LELAVFNGKLEPVTEGTKSAFNRGWYGCRMLAPGERYDSPPLSLNADQLLNIKKHEHETKIIDERYGPRRGRYAHFEPAVLLPSKAVDRYFASMSARQDIAKSSPEPSFSFVTPFFGGSLDHLRQCARSIADLPNIWKKGSRGGEWIVVNGSLLVSNDAILDAIPNSLSPHTVLLRDSKDSGLTGRLNQAILASRGNWILFVDADDFIMPNTIAVLKHYIQHFPRCRYISSGMIDVDEYNQILRYRLHLTPPTMIFSAGMIAGHLKAVRRDLIEDVGLLDPAFDLAQDYEFALRVAAVEPLLLIPDYLYCYRWHKNTQTVSRRDRQDAARDCARESTVLRLAAKRILPSWPWTIVVGSLRLARCLQRNAPILLMCGLVVGRTARRFFTRSKWGNLRRKN
jgi:glycosyltransferase involved in cell wall biosynthesis